MTFTNLNCRNHPNSADGRTLGHPRRPDPPRSWRHAQCTRWHCAQFSRKQEPLNATPLPLPFTPALPPPLHFTLPFAFHLAPPLAVPWPTEGYSRGNVPNVPWSAPRPPHVIATGSGHTRQALAHTADSRKLDTLWCCPRKKEKKEKKERKTIYKDDGHR